MASLKPPVSEKDHIQGPANAGIELLEYGDYECPHCGRAYSIIKSIQKELSGNIRFVFRNFPLSEIHPQALHAAIASEAADLQGKYWQMHDIIFEHQDSLRDTDLLHYAQRIGLDTKKFKSDFEEPALAQKVESDFESGVRSAVNGTPSFFVNGKKFEGDWEKEPFLKFLRQVSK